MIFQVKVHIWYLIWTLMLATSSKLGNNIWKFTMFLDFRDPSQWHPFWKTSSRVWNKELKLKFELLGCSTLKLQLLQLVFSWSPIIMRKVNNQNFKRPPTWTFRDWCCFGTFCYSCYFTHFVIIIHFQFVHFRLIT